MGLFGKKKKETKEEEVRGGGLIEPIGSNSEDLQDLLKEFREMRAGIRAEQNQEESEDVVEEEIHDGEEYQVSEEESESIENFLSGNDEVEEEIEEDVITEEALVPEEEIIDEEEVVEEEVNNEEELSDEVDEEELSEDFSEEDFDEGVEAEVEDSVGDIEDIEEESVAPVDVDVTFNEVPIEEEPDEEVEEEVLDEEEIIDDDYSEPLAEDVYEEVEPEQEVIEEQPDVDGVSSEELDKKFDDFEKRLLDKIMQQFAMMQTVQPKSEPVEVKKKEKTEDVADDELEISTVRGKLVINDYKFTGEVVMFTPIDSLRKATWEEVVRRKGHCTYHLTTSGNGGWFIKKSNAPNPYAYIEKKEDAEELAKLYAKREKAELKIHNSKGVIEKSLSFGREKLRG